MKFSKIISALMMTVFLGTLLAASAGAQTIADIPGVAVTGPTSVGGLVDLISYIVRWVYIIFFIIAVLFILFAAFTYLGAGGDPGKVESAKTKLVYAIVAIIIAFLAVGFEIIIRNFLQSPTA